MNEYYVYEWFIVETNEVFYVGKGKNQRYKQIRNRNKFFLDVYNTHNCDVKIVYEHLTEEEAFIKEKELIAYYRNNTNFRLTNVTDGGEGVSGWQPSQDFKNKQSKFHKSLWQNKEYRNKMINIRRDSNGSYQSDEFKNKISKLVSGTKNPNYANYWSDEQKRWLSNVRKVKGLSAGINNPRATRIICLETGEVFDLIQDAMKKYNVKHEGSFSVALKDRSKTAASLHWLKYDDELLDENKRFYELIVSLSLSSKCPIICVQTKEIILNRKEFLNKYQIGIKSFNKRYNGKITINQKDFMYIKDYLSRTYERLYVKNPEYQGNS